MGGWEGDAFWCRRAALQQRMQAHIFHSIEEAQDNATELLGTYNNDRPNMGIGGLTPTQKLKLAM